MQPRAIILSGGRHQDVVPVEGAHVLLTHLLGEAHSKPAIPTLKATQDAAGQHRVEVWLGSQVVGHLARDVDPGLLATIQACELNGAVARARGDLIASSDQPGGVTVRVSLADAEYLLCDPPPELRLPTATTQTDPAEQPADTTPGSFELASSLDDTTLFRNAAEAALSAPALDDEATPVLSSGWTEDYPEWPPPDLKPGAKPSGRVEAVSPAPAAPTTEPLPPHGLYGAAQPLPQTPTAPAATRTAWMGTTPVVSPAPQTGWLSAAAQPAQGLGAAPTTPGTLSGPAASAGSGAGTGTTAPDKQPSWQDLAERKGGTGTPDEQIVAAWASSPPSTLGTQPAARAKQAARSSTAKTLLLSALVVLVVAVVAFLVWKVMFAPKTYTDSAHGYSFSYPHGWDILTEGSALVGVGSLAGTSGTLNLAMAGHGLDSEHPNDVALVEVAWQDTSTAMSASQLTAELEAYYASAQAQGALRVEEPLSAASLAGLDGCKVGLAMNAQGHSVTSTCYFLVDGTGFYALMAISTPDLWSESQRAFDSFFKSFKPGATKM